MSQHKILKSAVTLLLNLNQNGPWLRFPNEFLYIFIEQRAAKLLAVKVAGLKKISKHLHKQSKM